MHVAISPKFSKFTWISNSLWKCTISFSNVFPIMLTIESRTVYKIWARTQTSFKYTSLWCSFLDPHPNHTSLKYRCLLKVSNRIRPTDRKHINSKHSPEYPPPRVRPETQGHESWWGHDTMTYPILTHRANLINLWGGCVLPAWIHLVVCKFTICAAASASLEELKMLPLFLHYESLLQSLHDNLHLTLVY